LAFTRFNSGQRRQQSALGVGTAEVDLTMGVDDGFRSVCRQVQAGQTFEISVRGQAVARLGPAVAPAQRRESAGSKMREFMQAQRELGAGAGMDLREMLEDGRA
jgi:antitoxin (DNA-binding transcriptional repressor) of toxin-antitoxin stability system